MDCFEKFRFCFFFARASSAVLLASVIQGATSRSFIVRYKRNLKLVLRDQEDEKGNELSSQGHFFQVEFELLIPSPHTHRAVRRAVYAENAPIASPEAA